MVRKKLGKKFHTYQEGEKSMNKENQGPYPKI